MQYWFERLRDCALAADSAARVWDTPHGRLLVTRRAARVLACQMPGIDDNLFFHQPDLERDDRADALFAGGGGLGGDRLWIAPEIGFIFFDLPKARKDPVSHAKLPAAMDPAQWQVAADGPGHLRLETAMNLRDDRTDKSLTLHVARQFDLIDAPADLPRKLASLSFSIRNDLSIVNGDQGVVAGAWDLLQLPPTGWLVCPTVSPVKKPRSYYNPFGPKHVKCDKSAVRFLIDGKRRIKMGIAPAQTTGRMGYYRKAGKLSTLIVRWFAPLPGTPYVDLPRSSNAFFGGDALQAYNDDGGGFGEMEYHDPAVVVGNTPASRSGACVTHVLAGPDAQIRAAADLLLGVGLPR